MVDRIKTRGVWGRMTAPARVNKVKRRKENANDKFRDHFTKRSHKHQTEEKKAAPQANPEMRDEKAPISDANTVSNDKPPSGDSDTGGHLDIRI